MAWVKTFLIPEVTEEVSIIKSEGSIKDDGGKKDIEEKICREDWHIPFTSVNIKTHVAEAGKHKPEKDKET